MKHIQKLLEQSCYITELYLGWNHIGQQGCFYISEGIKKNQSLCVLDLSHNQMGGFDKNSQLIQSGIKLMESLISKYCSVKHIDLSYNNFSRQEGERMAELLSQDKAIYGIHFEGNNGGFVDQRQFIMYNQQETKDEKFQQEVNVNLLFKKQINSILPIPCNNSVQQIKNSEKNKDICWICEGWNELQFVYKPHNASNNKQKQVIFLHLDFEDYEGFLMENTDKDGNFYCHRMCPPNSQIKFFFTEISHFHPELNKDYKQLDNADYDKTLVQNQDFIINYPGGFNKKMHKPRVLNYQMTSLPFQMIDSNSHEQIVSALPRPNGITPEIKIKGWDFTQAIMYDWKKETEKNLEDSFEFDFQTSKINKLCKSEEDCENLKQILKQYYPKLRYMYRYYSSINLTGHLYSISLNTFTDFIQHIPNIFDNVNLKLKDIDINFIGANQVQTKFPYKPERCLVRFTFMEMLVRMANDRFLKPKIAQNLTQAFEQFISEGFCTILDRCEDTQQWREERYWVEECDIILKENADFMHSLYERYACSQKDKHKKFYTYKFMSNYEFKDMWNYFDMYDELFSDRDPNYIFIISMQQQVDEINQERFMQMNFVEFLEAFARIAEKVSLPPIDEDSQLWAYDKRIWQPLDIKIENLINFIKPKFELLSDVKPIINMEIQEKEEDLSQSQSSESESDYEDSHHDHLQKHIEYSEDTYEKIYRAYKQIFGVNKSISIQNIISQEQDEKRAIQTGEITITQLKNQKNQRRKSLNYANKLRKFLIDNQNQQSNNNSQTDQQQKPSKSIISILKNSINNQKASNSQRIQQILNSKKSSSNNGLGTFSKQNNNSNSNQ